jgi:hypothetical protein
MNVKDLTTITWETFEALPKQEKAPYLMQQDGMPFHTLFAQQFDRSLLERLCALATRIRRIAKSREGALFLSSLLSHKRAMLYF